jgi:hypothetical protein
MLRAFTHGYVAPPAQPSPREARPVQQRQRTVSLGLLLLLLVFASATTTSVQHYFHTRHLVQVRPTVCLPVTV